MTDVLDLTAAPQAVLNLEFMASHLIWQFTEPDGSVVAVYQHTWQLQDDSGGGSQWTSGVYGFRFGRASYTGNFTLIARAIREHFAAIQNPQSRVACLEFLDMAG